MCLAMNDDRLGDGERCASTSNRNFEGRQGRGGRTHLVSPAMAAAAALTGRFADVRPILSGARSFSSSAAARAGASAASAASAATPAAQGAVQSSMTPFTVLSGAVAAPMDLTNVDTDMIIPKNFLKTIKRTGLGKHAFDEMRYNEDGSENSEFVLNQEPYRNAEVLVAGANFGCGSSREHAPWALLDFGVRCVIAPR